MSLKDKKLENLNIRTTLNLKPIIEKLDSCFCCSKTTLSWLSVELCVLVCSDCAVIFRRINSQVKSVLIDDLNEKDIEGVYVNYGFYSIPSENNIENNSKRFEILEKRILKKLQKNSISPSNFIKKLLSEFKDYKIEIKNFIENQKNIIFDVKFSDESEKKINKNSNAETLSTKFGERNNIRKGKRIGFIKKKAVIESVDNLSIEEKNEEIEKIDQKNKKIDQKIEKKIEKKNEFDSDVINYGAFEEESSESLDYTCPLKVAAKDINKVGAAQKTVTEPNTYGKINYSNMTTTTINFSNDNILNKSVSKIKNKTKNTVENLMRKFKK